MHRVIGSLAALCGIALFAPSAAPAQERGVLDHLQTRPESTEYRETSRYDDVALFMQPEWLDSLVLLIAPIYNADGNERVEITNRPRQNGPVGGMGQRANAQDYDLNRDHMKLDSPEARSLVRLYARYDPQVAIDLHTTNGSRHAYYLTSSASWPRPMRTRPSRTASKRRTASWRLPRLDRAPGTPPVGDLAAELPPASTAGNDTARRSW
jgi:hypothetical protein